METTLRELIEHRACGRGLAKLLAGEFKLYMPRLTSYYSGHRGIDRMGLIYELGDDTLDRPIPYITILRNNGINDTLWALRELVGLENLPTLVAFADSHGLYVDDLEEMDNGSEAYNDSLYYAIKEVITNDNQTL